MPYLTPDDIPEGDVCRPLFIPHSSDWLAIISGALTELQKNWNWEQSPTGITVAEAIARVDLLIEQYYDEECGACITPIDGHVIRISITGKIEELIGGEWVEATGDYVIPPPAAREDGSSLDQICLAAANAVNVIHSLYTDLSDSFANELTAAEALVSFAAAVVAIVGFEFAPITFAIAQTIFAVFQGVFLALSYLTADLWTEDFSKQIICFLVACASNDGGVVTFDWDCFNKQLNSLANEFSLSETQLRLYIQFGYILLFIGGADGLNLAGGTTEIETQDCSDCADGWCYEWDFTADDGGWYPYSIYGTYVPGVGWQSADLGTAYSMLLGHDFLAVNSMRYLELTYILDGVGGSDVNGAYWYDGTFHSITINEPIYAGEHTTTLFTDTTTADVPNVFINPNGAGSHTVTVTRIKITGDYGSNPFGTTNCFP